MNQKIDIKLRIRILLSPVKNTIIFPFSRWLKRIVTKKLKLHRPSTYPFISGDAFRSLASHIHDESSTFDPTTVDSGDIIFLNTDYYKEFFETKHPHITKKYILISHNSDICISNDFEKYIDEKIIHWFSRNVTTDHGKITPIPIGLINTAFNKIGKTSDLPKLITATKDQIKQPGISFGFSLLSGKGRVELNTLLKNHPFGIHILEYNQTNYFKKMNSYSFVASPEGNGPDCHRTWEALYLGCIPLVTNSSFISYFKKLGLPVHIVESWTDLNTFDEEFLQNTYDNYSKHLSHEALYMDYWMHKIVEEQQKAYLL